MSPQLSTSDSNTLLASNKPYKLAISSGCEGKSRDIATYPYKNADGSWADRVLHLGDLPVLEPVLQLPAASFRLSLDRYNLIDTSGLPLDVDFSPLNTDPERLTDLPDTWRAALNTYVSKSTAVVMETYLELGRANLIDDLAGVTIDQLLDLSKQTGRNLTRRVTGRGFQIPNKDGNEQLFTILPLVSSGSGSDGKSGKNPAGGRPAIRYVLRSLADCRALLICYALPRLVEKHFAGQSIAPVTVDTLPSDIPDADELSKEINRRYGKQIDTPAQRKALDALEREYIELFESLDNLTSTPIPFGDGWEYGNSRGYLACLARAIFEPRAEREEQVKGITFVKTLGVSRRSVAETIRNAGLTSTQVYREQVATCERDLSWAPDGFPMRAYIDGDPKTYMMCRKDKHDEQAISKAFRTGLTVTVEYQTASRLSIDRPAPLTCEERRQRAAQQHANCAVKHFGQAVNGTVSKTVDRPRTVKQCYIGTDHDPKWRYQQVINLLPLVGWEVNSDALTNVLSGKRAAVTLLNIRAALLRQPFPDDIHTPDVVTSNCSIISESVALTDTIEKRDISTEILSAPTGTGNKSADQTYAPCIQLKDQERDCKFRSFADLGEPVPIVDLTVQSKPLSFQDMFRGKATYTFEPYVASPPSYLAPSRGLFNSRLVPDQVHALSMARRQSGSQRQVDPCSPA